MEYQAKQTNIVPGQLATPDSQFQLFANADVVQPDGSTVSLYQPVGDPISLIEIQNRVAYNKQQLDAMTAQQADLEAQCSTIQALVPEQDSNDQSAT